MVGQQARAPGQAQVAHQQGGRWSGAGAQALKTHADLDQGGGEGELGLDVEAEMLDRLEVGVEGVGKAVRPEVLEAIELPGRGLNGHWTGSITLPASCRKADSARTHDSSSRVTT
jgi:hypothetical protein